MGSFGAPALWSLRPSFWARWRRERGVEIVGAGQERGGRSEVLAAEGGQGGGVETALTVGFGERGVPHFSERSRFLGHIFRP